MSATGTRRRSRRRSTATPPAEWHAVEVDIVDPGRRRSRVPVDDDLGVVSVPPEPTPGVVSRTLTPDPATAAPERPRAERRQAQRRPATRTMRARWPALAGWALLSAFLALQVVIILRWANGPSLDEGIYATGGMRTLQGHGLQDNYLTWFAGSLVWPVISGAAYQLAGLQGSRIAAAVLVTIGLAGAVKAAGNLFSVRVQFFAALAAVTSGPALALAHLAVYDALAVAGLGLCLMALTELERRDDRAWLVAAAVAYLVAVLAKYPVVFCTPALLGVLVVLRGRGAWLGIGLFGLIVGGVLVAFYMPLRGQLSLFPGFRTANDPTFGVTRSMIAVGWLLYGAVPLALALVGLALAKPRGRRFGVWLLLGLVIWPAYHLATGSPVGIAKHAVFGLVCVLPLVGLALAKLSFRPVGALAATLIVLALGALGAWEVRTLDRGWPDLRPTIATLQGPGGIRPGDQVLVNDAWPLAAALYASGQIRDPDDLYDQYAIEHGRASSDLCRYRWFIDIRGEIDWPDSIRRRILRCGTFLRLSESNSRITNIGRSNRFVTYNGKAIVYFNTRTGPR